MDISNSLLIQWLKGLGGTYLDLNISFTSFYTVTHAIDFNSSNIATMAGKFRTDASDLTKVYVETTWVNNNSHGYANYPVQLHLFGILV